MPSKKKIKKRKKKTSNQIKSSQIKKKQDGSSKLRKGAELQEVAPTGPPRVTIRPRSTPPPDENFFIHINKYTLKK